MTNTPVVSRSHQLRHPPARQSGKKEASRHSNDLASRRLCRTARCVRTCGSRLDSAVAADRPVEKINADACPHDIASERRRGLRWVASKKHALERGLNSGCNLCCNRGLACPVKQILCCTPSWPRIPYMRPASPVGQTPQAPPGAPTFVDTGARHAPNFRAPILTNAGATGILRCEESCICGPGGARQSGLMGGGTLHGQGVKSGCHLDQHCLCCSTS